MVRSLRLNGACVCKLGHCVFQIRPLGVETGRYPPSWGPWAFGVHIFVPHERGDLMVTAFQPKKS
jgi:hypothetical protein